MVQVVVGIDGDFVDHVSFIHVIAALYFACNLASCGFDVTRYWQLSVNTSCATACNKVIISLERVEPSLPPLPLFCHCEHLDNLDKDLRVGLIFTMHYPATGTIA